MGRPPQSPSTSSSPPLLLLLFLLAPCLLLPPGTVAVVSPVSTAHGAAASSPTALVRDQPVPQDVEHSVKKVAVSPVPQAPPPSARAADASPLKPSEPEVGVRPTLSVSFTSPSSSKAHSQPTRQNAAPSAPAASVFTVTVPKVKSPSRLTDLTPFKPIKPFVIQVSKPSASRARQSFIRPMVPRPILKKIRPIMAMPTLPSLAPINFSSMPKFGVPSMSPFINIGPRKPLTPSRPQPHSPTVPKTPMSSEPKAAVPTPRRAVDPSRAYIGSQGVPPPVGPSIFGPSPPSPPGSPSTNVTSPAGPAPVDTAAAPTPPPWEPIPPPKAPGVSRQRRAAGDESASDDSKPATDDGERPPPPPPLPPGPSLPHDVELLPGYSAPPGYQAPTESGAGTTEPPTPTPTAAGVPPPPDPAGDSDNTTEHINYEGLYYTIFAQNNTHQEIQTPLSELATRSHSCYSVRSVPNSVRRQLGLSYFYQRYTEAYGIPVLSSSSVPDAALRRACYILRFLFADVRTVRDSYRQRRGRVAVIGRSERTTQIPEHSSLGPAWDTRARGLGATDAAPVCTIGEENLLNYGYPADRWYTEDIGLHEFAHGLHLLGARYAIPAWERRLTAAYNAARRRGLWTNTYAATNHIEYFAEGVQKYHNVEAYSQYPNGIHNHVDTRAKLLQYDPALYQVVAEIFPCGNRYIGRKEGGFRAASDAAQLKLEYPSCRLEGSTSKKPKKPKPTKRPRPEVTTRFRETPTSRRTTTPKPARKSCRDNHHHCDSWARAGYCFSNAAYMSANCLKSCQACECRDKGAHCVDWAAKGECQRNPGYMLYNCRRSCRAC